MKRVLHISTSDIGGAANVCITIHNELIVNGYGSNVLTLLRTRSTTGIEQYNEYKKAGKIGIAYEHYKSFLLPWIFSKLLKDQEKKHEAFTFPYSLIDITKHPFYNEADIIQLHYASYLVNWKTFFAKNTKPIVWTLHDMNVFTGGCHHSEDCIGYLEQCGDCPQLKESWLPNLPEAMLRMKKNALSGNITFVSPSKWLMNKAQSSTLLQKQDIRFISNGIDLNMFKKRNKELSRIKHNLPINKKIILFLIDDFSRYNKGFFLFIDSIKYIKDSNDIFYIFIGNNAKNIDNYVKDFVCFPYIVSEFQLSELYSSADLLVLPSKYENCPLTVMESMACGTPVVSFNAAGQKDMIEHTENGYLANPYDTISFAKGITYCLDEKNHSKLSINCEIKAKNEYSSKKMFDSYKSLYNEIIHE